MAIVGMGAGDLRFQRDTRSQSIGTVEGDAPQLLAIRLGAGSELPRISEALWA